MSHPRGSEWSIWDLHVHTPASIVQKYGADDEATWARFIDELERLPPEFQVLGINDYWFLDGYKRIRQERAEGRLPNIREIFPVVEFRLNIFGGTQGTLRRQNMHVMFDPEVPPEVIESQFLNALQADFSLLPERQGDWSGLITKDSLADLGKAIKAAVPPEKVADYDSDVVEGFNSLVVDIRHVQRALDKHFFKGRHLTGLGKAEWASIKWNDQSIATKRTLINQCDFLFTAFNGASSWATVVDKLKNETVQHRLFDCSDAHAFSNANQEERLGNCHNWVNAEPTFSGLRHALSEFDHRVFVGLEPPHVTNVTRNPERYISTISVGAPGHHSDPVFDYTIDLNSQFVAVVGNKGQGKSALLDCLGLAGASPRVEEFAFLNRKRFLNSRNPDGHAYAATIIWRDGNSRTALFGSVTEALVEGSRVEYLPQAFVERVCTAEPNSEASREFEAELRKVLYSHIPEVDRAGTSSFDALLAKRTATLNVEIEGARAELDIAVQRYLELVSFQRTNPRAGLTLKLAEKRASVREAEDGLRAAQARLAAADSDPEQASAVSESRRRIEELDEERDRLHRSVQTFDNFLAEATSSEIEQSRIAARVAALQADAAELSQQILDAVYRPLRIEPPQRPPIELVERSKWTEVANSARFAHRNRFTSDREDFVIELGRIQREIALVSSDLEARDAERELARQRVKAQEDRLSKLKGAISEEGSLTWLEDVEVRLEELPAQLVALRQRLVAQSSAIHAILLQQRDQVAEMFKPVSTYVAQHHALATTDLSVMVDLEVRSNIHALRESLDRRRSNPVVLIMDTFPTCAPSDWANLNAELETLLNLTLGAEGSYRDPTDDFRIGYSARDFLTGLLGLNWIELRFELVSSGLSLSTMSPGQRGLILLLFYLLIDRGTAPLLLDQPEENLDNDTVASIVVPALHEAARRRQVIIVTHNANLAIVGDADQVIRCTYEDGHFGLESGPVSELKMATHAVSVLEGTKSALTNRWLKFENVVE